MTATTRTAPQLRQTKKYKALIAVGLDDVDALARLGHNAESDVDKIAKLVAAGFTEAEARDALNITPGGEPTEATPEPEPEPLTPKQEAEALVAASEYEFTRGIVRMTPDVIEAVVRVRKTGRPETIASTSTKHVKAVVIYKEDTGDVAVQNLTRKEA